MDGKIRLGAYAFCVADDAILLAQISDNDPMLTPGTWTLPGGGLDWGEDPADGMHRELHEETGLSGVIEGLLGIKARLLPPRPPDRDHELHSIQIVYNVACRGEPQVTEVDGTVCDARWVPLADLPDYPIVDLVRFALREAGLV